MFEGTVHTAMHINEWLIEGIVHTAIHLKE